MKQTNDAVVAAQHAALCYRQTPKGRTKILLITSRDTGRWVLPKGWADPGEAGVDSARREAHEEAGVVALPAGIAAGTYHYDKRMPKNCTIPCTVDVHVMKVDRLESDYREAGQRTLKWFSPRAASSLVDEPGLRQILRQFSPPGLT